jgi:DNA-binding NarL/FixJ family response regulator
LSSADYNRARQIFFAKAWLKVEDQEEAWSHLCELAVNACQNGKYPSVAAGLNHYVYWKSGEISAQVRNTSKKFSTGSAAWDNEAACQDSVEETVLTAVSRAAVSEAISVLRYELPARIVDAAVKRHDGLTNAEIAAELGIPCGTVQYRIEQLMERAPAVLHRHGLTSFEVLRNVSFTAAA